MWRGGDCFDCLWKSRNKSQIGVSKGNVPYARRLAKLYKVLSWKIYHRMAGVEKFEVDESQLARTEWGTAPVFGWKGMTLFTWLGFSI